MSNCEKLLKKLVGKEIVVNYTITEGILGRAVRGQKWLVTGVYPHFVMACRVCDSGAIIRECFDIGTLISKGIIKADDVRSSHYTYREYKTGINDYQY